MMLEKLTVMLLMIVLPHNFSLAATDLSEIKAACNVISAEPTFRFYDEGNIKVLLAVTGPFRTNKQTELYLHDGKTCRQVLSYEGYALYFYANENTTYPGVAVYSNVVPSGRKYFKWNGHVYEPIEIVKSVSMNKEALQLFEKGKLQEAITLWRKAAELEVIPGIELSANAEVLNNLGFAYYELGKEYFDEAEKYLKGSAKIEPSRWVVYLNLGDLYSEMNNYDEAIINYKILLNRKHDYKYKDKIISKIRLLERKKYYTEGLTFPRQAEIEAMFPPREDKLISIKANDKLVTLDLGANASAHAYLNGEIVFSNYKDKNYYLLMNIYGSSRNPPGPGWCGSGEEFNLIWLKLDNNLNIEDIESVLYESCLKDIRPATELQTYEIWRHYQIGDNTLEFEFIETNNDTDTEARYSFHYDNMHPEDGFTIKKIDN